MVDPAIIADALGKSANASAESRVMPDSEYSNTRPREERRDSRNRRVANRGVAEAPTATFARDLLRVPADVAAS